MARYLEFLEDKACLRVDQTDAKAYRQRVEREHLNVLKLVPPRYKITLKPTFFNHSDPDRIGQVLSDSCTDFLIFARPKKVMFSAAVKIFPYGSQVNSVRILLIKYHEEAGGEDDEDEPMPNEGEMTQTTMGEGDSETAGKVNPTGKKLEPQDVPPK